MTLTLAHQSSKVVWFEVHTQPLLRHVLRNSRSWSAQPCNHMCSFIPNSFEPRASIIKEFAIHICIACMHAYTTGQVRKIWIFIVQVSPFSSSSYFLFLLISSFSVCFFTEIIIIIIIIKLPQATAEWFNSLSENYYTSTNSTQVCRTCKFWEPVSLLQGHLGSQNPL